MITAKGMRIWVDACPDEGETWPTYEASTHYTVQPIWLKATFDLSFNLVELRLKGRRVLKNGTFSSVLYPVFSGEGPAVLKPVIEKIRAELQAPICAVCFHHGHEGERCTFTSVGRQCGCNKYTVLSNQPSD